MFTPEQARAHCAKHGLPAPAEVAALVNAAALPGLTEHGSPSKWEVRQERQIQDTIEKWLRLQGWHYIRPPMHQRSALPIGHPDFTVWLPALPVRHVGNWTHPPVPARVVCVEVKTATGRLSPEQTETIRKLEADGFACFVARSDETAIRWIREQAEPANSALTGCNAPVESGDAGR